MENTQSINGVKDKAKDAMGEIKDSLNEAGKEVGKAARKAVDELTHAGKERLKSYSEEGMKQLTTIEDLIKQYPIRSMVAGVVGGILISRLLK